MYNKPQDKLMSFIFKRLDDDKYEKIVSGINTKELFIEHKDLKDQLDTIHNELYNNTQSVASSNRKTILYYGKWVAAAAVIIFVMLTGINQINTGNIENTTYEKYYENPLTNNNAYFFKSSKFNIAKELFYNKDYSGTLSILDNISEAMQQEETEILFFKGLTLMELERHTEAIEKFEYIINSNNGQQTIQSITNWYLGLCYLKTSNYKKAVEQFEITAKYNGYNSTEAKNILRRLKKNSN